MKGLRVEKKEMLTILIKLFRSFKNVVLQFSLCTEILSNPSRSKIPKSQNLECRMLHSKTSKYNKWEVNDRKIWSLLGRQTRS